jgi:starch synthase
MIAQRYGTLPIVRETGGLKDTVFPYNKYTGEGSGFSFAGYNAGEMLAVIKMAFGVLRQVKAKKQLVKNAMLQDNSFTRSAKEYLRLYGQLIAK